MDSDLIQLSLFPELVDGNVRSYRVAARKAADQTSSSKSAAALAVRLFHIGTYSVGVTTLSRSLSFRISFRPRALVASPLPRNLWISPTERGPATLWRYFPSRFVAWRLLDSRVAPR